VCGNPEPIQHSAFTDITKHSYGLVVGGGGGDSWKD
jgi:hypothetical protein